MESRQYPRTEVMDALPPRGSLQDEQGNAISLFNVLNYSKSGLGVWIVDQLENEKTYQISLGDGEVINQIEVRWCQPSDEFGYNAGFLVKNLDVHLDWIQRLTWC